MQFICLLIDLLQVISAPVVAAGELILLVEGAVAGALMKIGQLVPVAGAQLTKLFCLVSATAQVETFLVR